MWEFILIAKKCLWSQISPLQVTVRMGIWKGRAWWMWASSLNQSNFFFFFFHEFLRTSEARNLLWEVFLILSCVWKETHILSALMCYFSVKACRNIFFIHRCFQIVYTEEKWWIVFSWNKLFSMNNCARIITCILSRELKMIITRRRSIIMDSSHGLDSWRFWGGKLQ